MPVSPLLALLSHRIPHALRGMLDASISFSPRETPERSGVPCRSPFIGLLGICCDLASARIFAIADQSLRLFSAVLSNAPSHNQKTSPGDGPLSQACILLG